MNIKCYRCGSSNLRAVEGEYSCSCTPTGESRHAYSLDDLCSGCPCENEDITDADGGRIEGKCEYWCFEGGCVCEECGTYIDACSCEQ